MLAALAASAGAAHAAGGAATLGQFAFIVGVHSPAAFCTGTLIRDNWLLTSAHCGDAGAPDLVSIADRGGQAFGPTDLIYSVPVAQWIPHPDYAGPGSANDIALIQLADGAADNRPRGEYGQLRYLPTPIAPATTPSSPANAVGVVSAAALALYPGGAMTRWSDGLATFPTSSCGSAQGPLDPARQLCLEPFADACASAGGGPVFSDAGGSRALYGIISKVGAGAACPTTRAVATYVPAYQDWIAQTITGGANGPIEMNWELPAGGGAGLATGISNVQGWAYSRAGAIASIRLERATFQGIWHLLSVPCCSERGDVLTAHPDAPLLTGFSAAINWAHLGLKPAFLTLIVRDTAGNERRELRTLQPVRILPGERFPTGLEFSDASSCTYGNENGRATIECRGVAFAQDACPGTIKLAWSDDKQAFEIVKGCR